MREVLEQTPVVPVVVIEDADRAVPVALANYGLDAGFVSALPDDDTGNVARSRDRVGIYYLESGANQRPSKVVYDRADSSICEAQPGDFDWQKIFDGTKWLHITGIMPALSESTADLSLQAVKAAKQAGVTVRRR